MAIPPIKIAPSILAADFRTLEREVKDAEQAGADMIHCDVMDGHFVRNLTFGPMVIEAVRKCVSIPLDVHLMIDNPREHIDSFSDAGADGITIHAEVCDDLPAVTDQIRSHGVRVGVSVNPDKPIDLFIQHLHLVDLVLIMTVFAGFGGQKFIEEALGKIAAVRRAAEESGLSTDLEVDGGITADTARLCAENGANVLVAGTYVFGAEDYEHRIRGLRRAAVAGASS